MALSPSLQTLQPALKLTHFVEPLVFLQYPMILDEILVIVNVTCG